MEIKAYDKYKKIFKSTASSGIKGNIIITAKNMLKICSYFQGYSWKNRLRFVRIYFDTPTFDTITKDRAAKFVDMLSAIGGTMGLLTGFSIISAVEIIYFATKIIINLVKNKEKQ